MYNGLPATLICDPAAAALMASGQVGPCVQAAVLAAVGVLLPLLPGIRPALW
jgi:hypothetical protein